MPISRILAGEERGGEARSQLPRETTKRPGEVDTVGWHELTAAEDLLSIGGEAAAEAARAARIHPPMSGQLAATNLVPEFLDLLQDHAVSFVLDWPAARKELIQVAAMCLRAIHYLEKR